jgi:hypothetical protein
VLYYDIGKLAGFFECGYEKEFCKSRTFLKPDLMAAVNFEVMVCAVF